MKEVMIPVLVMDDDCLKCDDFDIESVVKSRLYADDECVQQEISVRCKDVYKCHRLLKRLMEK